MGVDFNEFAHQKQLIPPETPDTAQRDTVYSFGTIDLRQEPIVISVPDVPKDQAYMLQLGDTSTETLPYISTITTNNKAGDYVLVGPDFQGYLPSDKFEGVITTRGQFVVIIGRTIVFDHSNLSPIFSIQEGMKIQPLSSFLGTEPPTEIAPVNFIPWDADKANGIGVFDYINMALAWHPPAIYEVDKMANFAQIGVIPGQPFSTDGLSDELVNALKAGITEAKQEIEQQVEKQGKSVNNWNWATEDISRFGADYLLRATISLKNIYPNAPDHAIYGQTFRDSDGQLLSGNNSYTLKFQSGNLPPVDWFWSLTLYDANTTAMYPNDVEKYNVSNFTERLIYDDDGSLTIYIANEIPIDKSKQANWLPAPKGEIYIVLRLYAPKKEVAEGKWTPPSINVVK